MSFLYVKIYHGPCHTFNSFIHKPQYFAGLRNRLQKLGFRVDTIEVDFADYCLIEMCGHEVFRCNIRHLKFNTPYYRDEVCQRAIEAVIQAACKFRDARSALWFWTLLDHQLFRRSKYAPKDYWVEPVEGKPFASLEECINCCQILVRKEKEQQKTQ